MQDAFFAGICTRPQCPVSVSHDSFDGSAVDFLTPTDIRRGPKPISCLCKLSIIRSYLWSEFCTGLARRLLDMQYGTLVGICPATMENHRDRQRLFAG